MSIPARTMRPLALVGLAAITFGMTGCANYETLEPYQPAAGVQTNAPGVKVRNLMILHTDGTSSVHGGLVAAQDDTLTSVTGNALKQDGSVGEALSISGDSVELPANEGVNLSLTADQVKGIVPGGEAELTLNFTKAGQIKMRVPVVDAKAGDISTAAPQDAAKNAG